MPITSHEKLRSRGVSQTVDGSFIGVLDNSSVFEDRLYKEWTRTVDYRSKIKHGILLPENPFTYERYTLRGGSFVLTRVVPWRYGVTTYTAYSDFGWVFGSSLNAFPQSVENAAIFRALSKARGNEFSVPLFVKEGRETSSMIVSRAIQLVHVATLAKRGQFERAYRTIFGTRADKKSVQKWNKEFGKDGRKAVGSFLLETSYGWLPLISDVRAALNTFMDFLERPEATLMSISASANSESWESGRDTLISFGNTFYRASAGFDRKRRDSCRITFRYLPLATSVPARLGLTNVPKFLWDATSLSFVVDWFIPVGSYLAQFDDSMRFSFHSGSKGRRQEVETMTRDIMPESPDSKVVGGVGRSYNLALKRVPLTHLPSVSLGELTVGVDMGFQRAINAIALLQQRWPRR